MKFIISPNFLNYNLSNRLNSETDKNLRSNYIISISQQRQPVVHTESTYSFERRVKIWFQITKLVETFLDVDPRPPNSFISSFTSQQKEKSPFHYVVNVSIPPISIHTPKVRSKIYQADRVVRQRSLRILYKIRTVPLIRPVIQRSRDPCSIRILFLPVPREFFPKVI